MDLTDKEELQKYLKSQGLWAKKGLGQNFLVDKDALDKIVEAAELAPSDLVVEVGPGVGTLTQELVQRAGNTICVELDQKLAELLSTKFEALNSKQIKSQNGNTKPISSLEFDNFEIVSDPPAGEAGLEFRILDLNHRLTIINADILKLNLNKIIERKPYKVVANIPYYITSKILELFLSAEQKPETIVLLVQKEVAERICAKPGGMSVLSVSVQLFGKPEIVGIVPASSFFPAPKVDSAILKIVVGSQPVCRTGRLSVVSKEQERDFFRLVHIGFASRRKTLANNLSVGYHIDKNLANGIIKRMGFKDSIRAQELGITDWKKLLNVLINKLDPKT
jgi:16S rRNA (adenine1518-N6/adenine1519-N6)-dimethyltransferase